MSQSFLSDWIQLGTIPSASDEPLGATLYSSYDKEDPPLVSQADSPRKKKNDLGVPSVLEDPTEARGRS